jgi:hypothetical protein
VRENFVRAGGGLAVKTAVTEHVLDIAPLDAFPNQDFPKGEKAVPATAMGALVAWVGSQSWRIHAMGATPVIFTSRQERTFSDDLARLAFGEVVSAFLMDVERGLPPTLGYLPRGKGVINGNYILDYLSCSDRNHFAALLTDPTASKWLCLMAHSNTIRTPNQTCATPLPERGHAHDCGRFSWTNIRRSFSACGSGCIRASAIGSNGQTLAPPVQVGQDQASRVNRPCAGDTAAHGRTTLCGRRVPVPSS